MSFVECLEPLALESRAWLSHGSPVRTGLPGASLTVERPARIGRLGGSSRGIFSGASKLRDL
jgi:hypothetical protein